MSIIAIILVASISISFGFRPSQYPDYCTKDINSRSIPPLTYEQRSRVTELVQTQVIVRHGARTPYAAFSCWQNYSIPWTNCNITEIMQASPSYSDDRIPSHFFYRKIYDAMTEELGGNCLTGQLITEGYQQEVGLGRILAKAYLDTNDLKLFESDRWDDIDTDRFIYLRSDDQSRVLLSGQLVIHSMFNVSNHDTIVDWHTSDYAEAVVAGITELFVMGGCANGRGNVTRVAEFNVMADPEAADIIFNSAFKNISVVSWELCASNPLPWHIFDKHVLTNAGGPTRWGQFISQICRLPYVDRRTIEEGKRADTGAVICDLLAVAIAINQDALIKESGQVHVEVELHGKHTRGMTIVDWGHCYDGLDRNRNIRWISKIHEHVFFEMFEKMFV